MFSTRAQNTPKQHVDKYLSHILFLYHSGILLSQPSWRWQRQGGKGKPAPQRHEQSKQLQLHFSLPFSTQIQSDRQTDKNDSLPSLSRLFSSSTEIAHLVVLWHLFCSLLKTHFFCCPNLTKKAPVFPFSPQDLFIFFSLSIFNLIHYFFLALSSCSSSPGHFNLDSLWVLLLNWYCNFNISFPSLFSLFSSPSSFFLFLLLFSLRFLVKTKKYKTKYIFQFEDF